MTLQVGEKAPDFELPDSEGGKTKLSDYQGKKNVLLVFYPLAFSTICTTEFCQLRDINSDLVNREGLEVIGISVDSHWSLKAWKEQERFPNKFVSDFWPHGKVAEEYGAFIPERGLAARATYLIDKDGLVRFAERNEPRDAREQQRWREEIDKVLKM